jgi:hypothetical protein
MVSITHCVIVDNSNITCTWNNVKTRKFGHTLQCQTGFEKGSKLKKTNYHIFR